MYPPHERHRLFWRTYVCMYVCKHFKCGYCWNCLLDLLLVCSSWQLYCGFLPGKAELNTDGLARRTVGQCLTNKIWTIASSQFFTKDKCFYIWTFTAYLDLTFNKQFLLLILEVVTLAEKHLFQQTGDISSVRLWCNCANQQRYASAKLDLIDRANT